jgi:recombinational DNA repair protein (RecF pathway)
MLKLECSVSCGNEDQYAGFSDTDHGIVCKECGQPANARETDELERMYPRWYLEAEFMLPPLDPTRPWWTRMGSD